MVCIYLYLRGVMSEEKPTYAELEKRIRELEKENSRFREVRTTLEESEERLRSLLDNSIAVIYLKDLEGKYLFINSRYEELFHVTKKEIIGKSDFDLFPPERAEEFQKNDREIVAHKGPMEFEEYVPHDDGLHTYISIKFPLFRITGEPYAVCGISTDITERKRAEDLLQNDHDELEKRVAAKTKDLTAASEKLNEEITDRKDVEKELNIFHYAVENSFDAIGMSTPEGRHWYQNRAFDELFGVISDDPPASVYADETQGREVFETIMAGGQWAGEVEMNTNNGKRITVNLRAYAVKDSDGKIISLVGMHTDITRQKTAEKELLLSEKKYRDLVEKTPDLLYRTDLNGEIIFISPSVFELTGYEVEEALEMKMAEEVYLHPEERANFLKELTEKGYVNNFEAELVRKDGSTWWAATNAHFFKDRYGNVMGVEGITRDITSLKVAEMERQELTRQLNREEKMKSLGLMAGGIAHDLNNILSGIVSYPDYVLMKLPEDSPVRRHVEVIKESGQRAADVVADLLTIARGVTAGKEILNLNKVIDDYTGSPEFKEIKEMYSEIKFEQRLDEELLTVNGSKIHMKKILMNLVINAAESIKGKGTVTVSTENRYLDRPLAGYESVEPGEYILLGVHDTGSGIAGDDLSRIFEPFYTKKTMGKSGTGLGLAVVYNAVQDHEGYIDVKSGTSGTSFEIYLQVYRGKEEKESHVHEHDDLNGRGEQILVIDDEERQRDIARDLLEQLGYRVVTVSGGEEALEYLSHNDVDLLVLDMIMEPGIDGLETYKRILDMKPEQKAVITSGYSETGRVAVAQALGAGAYVKKPYVIDKIGKAVKEELEK